MTLTLTPLIPNGTPGRPPHLTRSSSFTASVCLVHPHQQPLKHGIHQSHGEKLLHNPSHPVENKIHQK
ncbi:hypothetical protein C5167_034161 [Papaver somniferum]|uniref:Uncharacterized protein n=1 Tax=Papaver somniferum TaxID=3469 RepID=A0A4Y7KG64_PAPSO|nr:hypothetical protein C5167_034161 [Papaver somniferum]